MERGWLCYSTGFSIPVCMRCGGRRFSTLPLVREGQNYLSMCFLCNLLHGGSFYERPKKKAGLCKDELLLREALPKHQLGHRDWSGHTGDHTGEAGGFL